MIVSIFLKLFQSLDVEILYFFNSLLFSEFFLSHITELGNAFFIFAFLIPFLCILSLVIKKINYVSPSTIIFPGLVLGLFVQLVKNILNFPRPGGIEGINIQFAEPVFQSLSFPSGHAASIFFVGFWWMRLAFARGFTVLRYIIYLLVIIIASTRIIIGAHWFSDVLGSFAITMLFIEILNKWKIDLLLNKNIYLDVISIFIILGSIYSIFNFEVFDHI